MSDAGWTPAAASDVAPGATVRLADGRELLVSRIEVDFMGRPGLIAFIEDSPRQWYKAPMMVDTVVEIRSPSGPG
jgi:hypothetical protein